MKAQNKNQPQLLPSHSVAIDIDKLDNLRNARGIISLLQITLCTEAEPIVLDAEAQCGLWMSLDAIRQTLDIK